jgi:hypothetical protein
VPHPSDFQGRGFRQWYQILRKPKTNRKHYEEALFRLEMALLRHLYDNNRTLKIHKGPALAVYAGNRANRIPTAISDLALVMGGQIFYEGDARDSIVRVAVYSIHPGE